MSEFHADCRCHYRTLGPGSGWMNPLHRPGNITELSVREQCAEYQHEQGVHCHAAEHTQRDRPHWAFTQHVRHRLPRRVRIEHNQLGCIVRFARHDLGESRRPDVRPLGRFAGRFQIGCVDQDLSWLGIVGIYSFRPVDRHARHLSPNQFNRCKPGLPRGSSRRPRRRRT